MKRIVLFFLFSISLSAQTKGVIVDENNQPISNVNIWVENENIGTTSEENGLFTLNTINDKTLIFSALGFETQKIKAHDAEKVVMKVVIFKINEVVISKPKNTKEIEVGNSKDRFYLPESQTVPWIFVKKINLDPKNTEAKYVKNLIFHTKSEVENAVFRVRIFNLDKNDFPGEDLVSQEIIVKVKKGRHKTVVDMLSYKLLVPEQGIFFGFESLLTDGNKYRQEAVIFNTNKNIVIDNYAPHILYYRSKIENSYTFRAGIWTKQRFSMYQDTPKQNTVLAPAINVTLTN